MHTPWLARPSRLPVLMTAAVVLCACRPQPSAPIVPQAGHWTVQSEDVVFDTCDLVGTFGETGMAGGLTLGEASATGFTIVYDDDTETVVCTVEDGGLFSCDAYDETESGSQSGGSYTLTYTWGSSGSLVATTALTLDASMHLACDGNMCGQIGDSYDLEFPCELDVVMDVTAD